MHLKEKKTHNAIQSNNNHYAILHGSFGCCVLMCWYFIYIYVYISCDKRHMQHMQRNFSPMGHVIVPIVGWRIYGLLLWLYLNCWKCVYMFYVLWVLFLCPFAITVFAPVGCRCYIFLRRTTYIYRSQWRQSLLTFLPPLTISI